MHRVAEFVIAILGPDRDVGVVPLRPEDKESEAHRADCLQLDEHSFSLKNDVLHVAAHGLRGEQREAEHVLRELPDRERDALRPNHAGESTLLLGTAPAHRGEVFCGELLGLDVHAEVFHVADLEAEAVVGVDLQEELKAFLVGVGARGVAPAEQLMGSLLGADAVPHVVEVALAFFARELEGLRRRFVGARGA